MTRRIAALLIVSCHAPDPATIDVPKVDAAAPVPSASADVPAVVTVDASKTKPGPPPPGLWDVAVSERSSTCRDAGVASFSIPAVFVPMRPYKDGKQGANLPVSVWSPVAQARSDVLLEVGQVVKSTMKPDQGCAYEVKREIEVQSVSGDSIAIVVRMEYGDAKGCTRNPRPVSCKHEATMTFTLAKALCEPRCGAEYRPLPDGGTDVKCLCLDGGT